MHRHFAAHPWVAGVLLAGVMTLWAWADGALPHGIDTAAIDRSVSPGEDFYRFANGKWLAAAVIPPERQQLDSFTIVIDRTREVLGRIMEEIAAPGDAPADPLAAKLGALYRSGMDTGRIDAAGHRPLVLHLARIAAIQDPQAILSVLGGLHAHGVGAGFRFAAVPDLKDSSRTIAELGQGGLGLPDRDYYLAEDDKSKALRAGYLAHVARMLELLGTKRSAAEKAARSVLAFETRLARAARDRADLRDPHRNYHWLDIGSLEKQSGLSWTGYFDALGLAVPKGLNLAQPDFVRALGRMIAHAPLDDWRIYLRWHLVHAYADSLSAPFEDEDFRFYATVMRGVPRMRPRAERVRAAVDDLMGEAVGRLYVARAFPTKAQAAAEALVANIRATLRARLDRLDWMSPPTRREALRKLDAMRQKIGHPSRWRDYSGLVLDRPVYADNVLAARAFQVRHELKKIGRPIDRDEWEVTPQTVNAYYKESRNEIVLPAAIWQPPFFDPAAEDAVNYGGLGMIIGHEMTHAFDDRGRQFDADGNLRDWWAPADDRAYREQAERLVKQYDGYVAIDDIHVNGRLTLGENIADLGGLTIAFHAFERTRANRPAAHAPDGFTPDERFFLAFAQLWRGKLRPEYLRFKLRTSDHTQGRFRVLGPLANMPEFFDAFAIPPVQSGAWRNPNPVRIW
jgi:predicted metalloendopeptidase